MEILKCWLSLGTYDSLETWCDFGGRYQNEVFGEPNHMALFMSECKFEEYMKSFTRYCSRYNYGYLLCSW